MLTRLILWLLVSFSTCVYANNALTDVLSNARTHIPKISQPTVLPVEQAFALDILLDKNTQTLQLNWTIAPDYYLYQEKLSVSSSVPLKYSLPDGTEIIDEFFGDQMVYFNHLTLTIPVPQNLPTTFPLTIDYQGCASAGFCYPPITETWEINQQTGTSHLIQTPAADGPAEIAEIKPLSHASAFTLAEVLANTGTGWMLLLFYGLGLLLTFTPCVLPMVPILSSIIIGEQTANHFGRSFLLSLSYVLGMAVTYTLAGVFAGLAGQTLQSYLQTPLFIGISAGFLVLLALNLFGLYRLQLPSRWQQSIHTVNQRIGGGRYLSAALLGLLSALVVSPCVTAPLIGALTYISSTGNAWLGGSALFALALGMGTPLLLIGTLGAHLLPRAGGWLISVQRVFGVLLIAVAIWLVSRLFSEEITLILWGILAIMIASYCGALQFNTPEGWPRFLQGIAWILLLMGALFLIRGAQPLLGAWFPAMASSTFSSPVIVTNSANAFIPVKTWADVQQQIQQSTKPVLLDFYAQWCVSCKIIEQHVFPDPQVAALLAQFTLLRADVTAQDSFDRELQKEVGVFAPPALLFFAPAGDEVSSMRVVGEVTPEMLAKHLETILNSILK
ncbi:MAG: protein-disulfide reductase DsbD [Gammaproteobacteria bacterium]